MAQIRIFEEKAVEYDAWFDEHHALYQSELNAVRKFISDGMNGLEVGIGSARFSTPLGIRTGIDTAKAMVTLAQGKGIHAVKADAEAIPFPDGKFEFVLMVNLVCFVEDVNKCLKEAYRVIQPEGFIVVAFMDKNGILAKKYQKENGEESFYKEARFYSAREVEQFLKKTGFKDLESRQTIFDLKEDHFQDIKDGSGEGAFVVIKGKKP
jgi:ubiquinone/menaquinone biosynthesis C-methylase UbiE